MSGIPIIPKRATPKYIGYTLITIFNFVQILKKIMIYFDILIIYLIRIMRKIIKVPNYTTPSNFQPHCWATHAAESTRIIDSIDTGEGRFNNTPLCISTVLNDKCHNQLSGKQWRQSAVERREEARTQPWPTRLIYREASAANESRLSELAFSVRWIRYSPAASNQLCNSNRFLSTNRYL